MKANHWLQSLVVLYSAIDTLAWATRPQGDVTRADFAKWVTSYMKPEERLGCTATDLYAARCALVHSGSAQSRMSRQGDAIEIWYVTAAQSVPILQAAVERKRVRAKVVCITDLVQAFADGVMAFVEDLGQDEALERQTADRIRWWLAFMPAAPIAKAWESEE